MSVASVDKPLDAWSLSGDDEEDCAEDGNAIGFFCQFPSWMSLETVFHDFTGGDHSLRG